MSITLPIYSHTVSSESCLYCKRSTKPQNHQSLLGGRVQIKSVAGAMIAITLLGQPVRSSATQGKTRTLHRCHTFQWLNSCKLYPKTQIRCSTYRIHQSHAKASLPEGKAEVTSFSCIGLCCYCYSSTHCLLSPKPGLLYRMASPGNKGSNYVLIYSITPQEN